MLLKGSCHCRAVTFEVEAAHPYPFCRCYCAICRKTAGGGGFAINLGAEADTLKITGADRKSTRLNSSHIQKSRMPSSA